MTYTAIVTEDFSLLDMAPIGAFVINDNYEVLFWNNRLEVWTGVRRSEILGSSIIERFPNLKEPKYLKRIKSVLAGGPPTIFSSQLHKHVIPAEYKDGSLRVQHTTVTSVPVHGGGRNALFIIQDVSDLNSQIQSQREMRNKALQEIEERKRIEDELRKNQWALAAAQGIASISSWEWSPSSGKMSWSKETFNILGINEKITEPAYDALLDRVHPKDRAKVTETIEEAIRDKKDFSVEHRIVTPSGKEKDIHSEGKMFSGEERVDELMIGTLHDITDRKQAERKLILSDAILENTNEGVMITDSRGVIQSVNAAFTTITGYTAREAEGQRPSILKSGRHDINFYKKFWEALKKEGSWKGEFWNKRKSGEVYPQDSSIVAIRDDERGEVMYASIIEDITDRKMTEETLRLLSSIDGLTGLANRRNFDETLENEWRRATRDNSSITLIMFDIDYFKVYNDNFGHQAGDKCLKTVAGALKSIVRRPGDLAARYGGEEFAIILPVTVSESGSAMAEQMRANVESLKIHRKNSTVSEYITVSAGCATVIPRMEMKKELFIEHADKALYKAKNEGRNRVVIAEEVI